MRRIVITPLLNGYSVEVGCQTVCFESKTRLVSELSRYLDNPGEVEAEYLKNAVNKAYRGENPVGAMNPTPVEDREADVQGTVPARLTRR